MKIDEMNLEEVEARLAEIASEIEQRSDVELSEDNSYEQEITELQTRKAQLIEAEERKATAKAIERDEVKTTVIEERKEEIKMSEERKIFGVDTPEYRDAFYAMLGGTATEEQRAIVVDANGNPGGGDAIAIPKTLDEKIWDGIHTAHPILADVSTIKSGVAMEVTKHVSIAVRTTKKADVDANAGEEENTFVKVVLYGEDYEKYVELSYAEAKMSQGALEDYLAEEISAELGEALAKDVFAQILSDATTAQKVTASADLYADVKAALAKANVGGKKTIYAPSTSYYEIVGAIKSGSPFNMGTTLGVEVKCDDAATCVVVVAPNAFILNVVQDTMIESDKDTKNHKVIVSGYLRAQGTLRKNKAAAYIA